MFRKSFQEVGCAYLDLQNDQNDRLQTAYVLYFGILGLHLGPFSLPEDHSRLHGHEHFRALQYCENWKGAPTTTQPRVRLL